MNGPSYVVVGVLIILFCLYWRFEKPAEPYLAADAVVMVEVGTAAGKRNIRIIKKCIIFYYIEY